MSMKTIRTLKADLGQDLGTLNKENYSAYDYYLCLLLTEFISSFLLRVQVILELFILEKIHCFLNVLLLCSNTLAVYSDAIL